MPNFPTIPTALSRRLLLNLLGFRLRDGRWHCPCGCPTAYTEAEVDGMDEAQWAFFVRRWLVSAAPTN